MSMKITGKRIIRARKSHHLPGIETAKIPARKMTVFKFYKLNRHDFLIE